MLLVLQFVLAAQKPADQIKINQVGYYPASSKIAVITGKVPVDVFCLVTADGKDTLYEGSIAERETKSAYSATVTRIADFSAFNKSGDFVLRIRGVKQSFPFRINNDVYNELSKAVLKGFYYQRSSIPLEEKYAGKWNRPAGHPDVFVLIHPSAVTDDRPAGTVISSPGGWYDAGDYNKYIVNSGITMYTLLSAYEDFPTYFDSLKTNIPESADKIPDVLNEAIYNLRWMFTMQDPNDGGVYHKCTNADFDGMVMPGVTKAPRYVVQKSTAATLDFAAVMAQAARIFKKMTRQLPRLADSCLRASASAWYWALKHPSVEYDQARLNKEYKPAISTGAYGDKQLDDEWMWAATEMFVTSKNKMYYEVIEQNINDSVGLPSWSNVRMLAYYTLLRYRNNLPRYASDIVKLMRQRLLKVADEFRDHINSNAFQTVMGQSKRDFIWGSNSVAANQAILLINAYFLTSEKRYMYAALSNLDYLLGRNATGYCFVTGFGTKSPMHPHHRPSVADGVDEPVPGLLVGGPNPARQDKCHYLFTDPETSYLDSDCAYASNEIAINWNAAMVYLVGAIEALQYELGFSDNNPATTMSLNH
ncbi:MAG TPA: glycoside hydrolase family 9 protein [Chitinophagaceae bacterium]|nr:glycoside hydrolase family 9 protein [Chitinophagaceae bacterium]